MRSAAGARDLSDRFPSPFEIETPQGAEGWEELYSYHVLFSDDRRAYEDDRFWFQDGMHWPEPLPPWDASFVEYGLASLSQCNTRLYVVPPALGIDMRILNGYVYMSPVGVEDPEEVTARAAHFVQRAGFYFEHWDELYARWMDKVRNLIDEMEALRFEPLPEIEPLERVTGAVGTGSGFDLVADYERLVVLALTVWQYHFEFLNLGYAAYLDYFSFCKQAFPGMPELAIAKTVAGVEVHLFRPDEEVKALARAAVDLGVGDVFASTGDPDIVLRKLAETRPGQEWLERFAAARHPWFNFSTGSGMYHSDRIWSEDLSIPFGFIAGYIARLAAGERIERPIEELRAERDRIAGEYAELLDDEDRESFRAKLALARMVFPYVENHNFYIEHWSHSIIWRKMRDIGRTLEKEAFLAEADDIFYLRRNEVSDVLFDYYTSWAAGVAPRGPTYWPPRLERRKRIVAALKAWSPPKALGRPPAIVTEPFTIMLWGVTSESIRQWLGQASSVAADLTGFAASPGLAEGRARVISSVDEIGDVEQGDVLVASLTAPSWAPIFSKLAATVTDTGGIMSHAAIVCREYGLPAVTGTASATAQIRTGQRIRVDGTAGTVTFLD